MCNDFFVFNLRFIDFRVIGLCCSNKTLKFNDVVVKLCSNQKSSLYSRYSAEKRAGVAGPSAAKRLSNTASKRYRSVNESLTTLCPIGRPGNQTPDLSHR